MLKNRDRVTIYLKKALYGANALQGTIYTHTPEWIDLDWDGVTPNDLKPNFHSILIPRDNIVAVVLIEQA